MNTVNPEYTVTSAAPAHSPVRVLRAVRSYLAVVVLCGLLGGAAGWLYLTTTPAAYMSTASVLINPSTGNPYSPTPSSVRQDEAISLETEAQVASSVEVLSLVADRSSLTVGELEKGLQVIVPPNTQVLQFTYTAADAEVARQVCDAIAESYLANRDRRFDDVNSGRIERIANRTTKVVADLRAATAAAGVGSTSDRLFQEQLADALGNELVSLRAQRTALESTQSAGGSVISPAAVPVDSRGLTVIAFPVGGLLVGLALGCLIAVLLERTRGVVRTTDDVEQLGTPVIAAVPARSRFARGERSDDVATTVRRLRAAVLDREPRPEIIAVAPAGAGDTDARTSEAVAESFARAGHRVVLVQTGTAPPAGGLAVDKPGLAQALLHERLSPLELLQPSVDPLLCLLPDGGFDDHSRELLTSDRLRTVLEKMVSAGYLVVLQSPGIESVDGEAIVGAADLGLVVVIRGRSRSRSVQRVAPAARTVGTALVALVVDRRRSGRPTMRTADPFAGVPVVAEPEQADSTSRDDDAQKSKRWSVR